MNGLLNRNDYETIKNNYIINIIGAGSGNGLIKSILYESNLAYGITEMV